MTVEVYGVTAGEWVSWVDGDPIDPGTPLTLAEELIAEANLPVNAADAAVQANDLSGFTTVTTFAALRDALDAGQWVRVNTLINCTAQLLVTTGAALYVDTAGEVRKAYNSSGATSNTFIRTKNINTGSYLGKSITPSHDVYIGGPGKINARTAAQGGIGGGNMIGIAGDNLVLDGFGCTFWDGGRYCIGIGDNWRIRRVDWRGGDLSGSGNGGLRYMGGTGLRVIESHCESGDDTWQIVQAGAFTDPYFDVSAYDLAYVRCTGSSGSARFLIAALQDQNNDNTIGMTCEIDGVLFLECEGRNGGTSMTLKNTSSSGAIRNVHTVDCVIDGTGNTNTTGQPGAIYIDASGAAAGGGIRDCEFTNTDVINSHRPGLRFGTATKVFDIRFTDCQLDRGTGAGAMSDPVAIIKGTRTVFDGVVLNRKGNASAALTDQGTGSVLDYTTIN